MQYCKECGAVLQRGTDKCVKCGADINLGEPYVVYKQFGYQTQENACQFDMPNNIPTSQWNYQENIPDNQYSYQNNMTLEKTHSYKTFSMVENPQNYNASVEAKSSWLKCLYITAASVFFCLVYIAYSNNSGWHVNTVLDVIRFLDEKIYIFYLISPVIIAVAFVVCYFEDDIIATVCIVVTINLFRLWFEFRGVDDRASLQELINAIGIIALIVFSILVLLDAYQYGDKLYDASVLFSVLHLVIYMFGVLNQLDDESYFTVDFSSLLAPVFYYLQFGYWGLALHQE